VREDLGQGAWVEHNPGFVPAGEAAGWLAALQRELAWEQREIVLFGRPVMQPRLIAWAGEVPYRYSGQTLPARPFTPGVTALAEQVIARTGVRFNHVLLNRYRDGRDSMGLHADAEPELGEDPVVATLSLGATRHLLVVPRKKDGPRRRYALGAGDLLVMGGTCQRHFRHGIPKETAVEGERISLTLRRIVHVHVHGGRAR
jgi:alkylated DNA repair dioxygenase AlkB